MKRVADLLLAIPIAVIGLPVCLLLMVVVRMETSGAPLLVQTRVGRMGRPFRLFKIRTMRADTPAVASHQVGTHRITRVGAVLRRLKLDELPQVINVLNGSMSFVGPRPCLPTQRELIEQREARGLLAFLPGITGPGQVAGIDMSTPELLARTEHAYFQSASLASDLALMWRTVAGGGRGDAASAGRGG